MAGASVTRVYAIALVFDSDITPQSTAKFFDSPQSEGGLRRLDP
jgi:hypothetical protein